MKDEAVVETIFEKFERWARRKNEGESQVGISRSEGRGASAPYLSRVLKHVEKLPGLERRKYRRMLLNEEITEGAVLDLIKRDEEERPNVLDRAAKLCKARDIATEEDRGAGRKGRRKQKGKITADEIRQAIRELRTNKNRRTTQEGTV